MTDQVSKLTAQVIDVTKGANALTAATVLISASVAILEAQYGTKTAVFLLTKFADEALKG